MRLPKTTGSCVLALVLAAPSLASAEQVIFPFR